VNVQVLVAKSQFSRPMFAEFVITFAEVIWIVAQVEPLHRISMYLLIVEPPLVGAAHVTVTAASPAVTEGAAAVPGTPLGTAASEAGDASPRPIEFLARTVKV
jgi:hypothetical protein